MSYFLQHARSFKWHLIALLIYTACAVFVTYPLITHLDTHFIANEWGQVDGFLSIWNLWWTGEALRTGQNPFFTHLVFHPQGFDLFWLWLSLPNGLLIAPITLAFGPLVAYNLTIIGSYILGGYFAFLFVRQIVRDDLAALVGGALYTLTSFHLRRVLDGVMDTATIQWVPLYFLALHSLLERPRWWKALLSGFLVLCVGLGSWYYGLFCLMYTGMAAAVWAFQGLVRTKNQEPRNAEPQNRRTAEPRTQNPEPISNAKHWVEAQKSKRTKEQHSSHTENVTLSPDHLVSLSPNHQPLASDLRLSSFVFRLLWGLAPIMIWAILIAPQILSMVQHGDQQFGIGLHANADNSADLIDFFVPSRFHPLWGEAVTRWYAAFRPEAWPRQISLGWVAMILAAIGARARWRECLPWLIVLGATVLLSMGEQLQIYGHMTGIPMPYALIADLPGIRTSHRPSHILLLSMLLLALIGSYGVAALMHQWPRFRNGLAVGACAAALLIDGWGGILPLYSLPIPSGYAMLPPHQGGAILPIPVNLNVARGEQLWFQTAHHWPIIGGYTGREPAYPIGKYAPGVRELRYGRYEPDDIVAPGWPDAQLSMLSALDIRYVLFHPDLMGSSITSEREVIAAMGLTPTYSDEQLEIYPVPQQPAPGILGYLGDGWAGLERDGERRWRWLGADPGELHLYNPHDEARSVNIELHLESFLRDRPLSISIDGLPPITINATRAEMRRTLKLWIGPGQHVVYFSAPADRPESGNGPLRSVAVLGIAVTE